MDNSDDDEEEDDDDSLSRSKSDWSNHTTNWTREFCTNRSKRNMLILKQMNALIIYGILNYDIH